MDYFNIRFRVIHWDNDDFNKMLVVEKPEGELKLIPEPCAVYKGDLPLILLWKYKVSKGDKLIFSYVGEDRYQLNFNKPHKTDLENVRDIHRMIDHSHMKYCLEWEERISETSIFGKSLPQLTIEDISSTSVEVLLLAKQLGLIPPEV